MRKVMRNWMLGTALVAGLFGTGAVAANAAAQEFRGRPEQRLDRGNDRGFDRGFDRGNGRGYERPVARGYGRPGYGVVAGGPYAEAYVPSYPGNGYVGLNGAWVFRDGPGVVRGGGYGRGERFHGGLDRGRGLDRGFDRRGGDRGFRGRR